MGETRLYQFSHYMLSPMAKGIQNTHSAVELFVKYTPKMSAVKLLDESSNLLWHWASNDKTVVSLSGGTSPQMNEILELLEKEDNNYPWSFFCEDDSLEHIMTSISIVLPEKIYETARKLRFKLGFIKDNVFIDEELETLALSSFDVELIESINKCGLAS